MTTASSLPPRETRNKRPRLKVRTQVQDILNYPTETVSIDYYGFAHDNKDGTEMTIPPHTILLFVPGNPGCIQWYIQLLYGLVSSLGIGFAARGVSYAGHGVSDAIANVQQYDTDESNNTSERDTRIPWTVDGQMDHKMEWIDMIIHELKNEFPRQEPPRFIFLTHSIGAHLVQRLLVIRSDVLIEINSHSSFNAIYANGCTKAATNNLVGHFSAPTSSYFHCSVAIASLQKTTQFIPEFVDEAFDPRYECKRVCCIATSAAAHGS